MGAIRTIAGDGPARSGAATPSLLYSTIGKLGLVKCCEALCSAPQFSLVQCYCGPAQCSVPLLPALQHLFLHTFMVFLVQAPVHSLTRSLPNSTVVHLLPPHCSAPPSLQCSHSRPTHHTGPLHYE